MHLKALFLNCTLKKSPNVSNTGVLLRRVMGLMEEMDVETQLVTGNEDGAHDAAGTTLFNLSHLGCTVPPNCDCYWVGDAGPGPSYVAAHGERHMYTNKTARYLAHNVVWFARLLKANPIPTNLRQLAAEAQAESADICPARHGSST